MPGTSSHYRSLLNLVDLIPTEAKDLACLGLILTPKENIDGKAFKQKGEAGPFFCPGDGDGLDPMSKVLDSRDSAVEDSLELHSIKMSPLTFFSVVIDRAGFATLRAGCFLLRGPRHPQVNPKCCIIYLHFCHNPGLCETQKL